MAAKKLVPQCQHEPQYLKTHEIYQHYACFGSFILILEAANGGFQFTWEAAADPMKGPIELLIRHRCHQQKLVREKMKEAAVQHARNDDLGQ